MNPSFYERLALKREIAIARLKYHESKTRSGALKWLTLCNKLQRRFYRLFGCFVPHSDGHVYVYDTGMKYWVRWQTAGLA